MKWPLLKHLEVGQQTAGLVSTINTARVRLGQLSTACMQYMDCSLQALSWGKIEVAWLASFPVHCPAYSTTVFGCVWESLGMRLEAGCIAIHIQTTVLPFPGLF